MAQGLPSLHDHADQKHPVTPVVRQSATPDLATQPNRQMSAEVVQGNTLGDERRVGIRTPLKNAYAPFGPTDAEMAEKR